MLTLQTSVDLDGITAAEIFDFLADPDDGSYQAWWPGTHLQLHVLERGLDHVGDLIYMDEYVGMRRLRMTALVTDAIPARKLAWQLKKGILLPAWLSLELEDRDGGVKITHTTRAGLRGVGRVLDPLLRLMFSNRFARELDEHVRTEFPRLRDLVRQRQRRASPATRKV